MHPPGLEDRELPAETLHEAIASSLRAPFGERDRLREVSIGPSGERSEPQARRVIVGKPAHGRRGKVGSVEDGAHGRSCPKLSGAPVGDQLLERRGRLVPLSCRCIGDDRQDGESVTHPP
jgi:hypothetical protein